MGHISLTVAERLVSKGFVTGITLDISNSDGPIFCESCVSVKTRWEAIPKVCEGKQATVFGGEVHSDMWSPAPVETLGGCHYFVSFADDYSWLTHIYLLHCKSDTFEAYKTFEAWTSTQLNANIKVLHYDHGSEYLSDAFIKYLIEQGTIHKLTVHDIPKQNGVAEVFNHIALEWVHVILHGSCLPKFLWGEGVHHVVWLKNHTSTAAMEAKTPIKVVTGKKPD